MNRHSPRGTGALETSIQQFGLGRSIVVDVNGKTICGNATLEGAASIGLERIQVVQTDGNTLVVVQRTDLDLDTDARARGLAIADNRVAELNIDLDPKLLAEQIAEFDLKLPDLGYVDEELKRLLDEDAVAGQQGKQITEDDELPPLPIGPTRCKLGDLWLLCGDSTKPADVATVMDGQKAVLMNTDPPYGISYDVQDNYDAANAADGTNRKSRYEDIKNDELTGDALQKFLEDCIRAAVPHLTPHAAFYLWHPMLTQGTFFAAAAAAAAAAILIHRQIIWAKPHFIFGRGDYHWKHELCFYGWVKGNRPPFYGPRNQDTVWSFNIGELKNHPSQKPVELFAVPMKNHARPGEICYEPFAGSGSQFIAAEQLGCRCFGIELAPAYCDLVISRWEKLTGKTATRDN